MHNFLSTTIQHTKDMLVILWMGTWNYVFSRDQSRAIPTPVLNMHLTRQQFLSQNSSALPTCPSLPFPPLLLAIHLPCHRKKYPITSSPQKLHLPDFCKVTRKGTLVCSLPRLDLLRTFPSYGSWDAVTVSKSLK